MTAYIITGVAATQYHRLGKSGLTGIFKRHFIFRSEAASQKPQPEYLNTCFKKMGRRDVENMLVIGDPDLGYQGRK